MWPAAPWDAAHAYPIVTHRFGGLFSTRMMVAWSCTGHTCSSSRLAAELKSAGLGLTDAPTTSWRPRSIPFNVPGQQLAVVVCFREVAPAGTPCPTFPFCRTMSPFLKKRKRWCLLIWPDLPQVIISCSRSCPTWLQRSSGLRAVGGWLGSSRGRWRRFPGSEEAGSCVPRSGRRARGS